MTTIQTPACDTYRFLREINGDFIDQPGFLFIANDSTEYLLFSPASRTISSFDMYLSDWKGSKTEYVPLYALMLSRITLNSAFLQTPGADNLLDYLDRIGYEEPLLVDNISKAYNDQSTLEFDQ